MKSLLKSIASKTFAIPTKNGSIRVSFEGVSFEGGKIRAANVPETREGVAPNGLNFDDLIASRILDGIPVPAILAELAPYFVADRVGYYGSLPEGDRGRVKAFERFRETKDGASLVRYLVKDRLSGNKVPYVLASLLRKGLVNESGIPVTPTASVRTPAGAVPFVGYGGEDGALEAFDPEYSG